MGAENPTLFCRACWRNALGTQAVVTTMGRTERFYQHREWGFRGLHKIIFMDRRRPLAQGMWRLRLSSFTICKWNFCELRFGNSPVQGLACSTCKISDLEFELFIDLWVVTFGRFRLYSIPVYLTKFRLQGFDFFRFDYVNMESFNFGA